MISWGEDTRPEENRDLLDSLLRESVRRTFEIAQNKAGDKSRVFATIIQRWK